MLLRVLFTITAMVTLGITGGFVGGLLLNAFKGPTSLEGGAYIFWFITGGMLCGLLTGVLTGKRLTQTSLRAATFISTLLAIGLIAGIIVMVNTRPSRSGVKRMQPTAVPAKFHQGQKLPMGLGMVNLQQTNATLYLYNTPTPDQLPEESKPIDSLTFNAYGNIAAAPAFFVPEMNKTDYGFLYCRVVSASRFFIEVIVNTQTMATAYVNRSAVRYLPWPDFFLEMFSVHPLNSTTNPVRARPFENGSIIKIPDAVFFQAVSVHGDWLRVRISTGPSPGTEFGYIRWRDANQLLIDYSPLS